jgi:cyclopropane fatty-acyl-phospholipid synthase-like methyltransferase
MAGLTPPPSPFNADMTRLLSVVWERRDSGLVLDGGCGNAKTSLWLANAGCDVLAIDVDLPTSPGVMVERECSAGRLRLLRDDLFSVQPTEPFATAALFGVLHYAGNAERVQRLLTRVSNWLQPRGVVVLSWITDRVPITHSVAFLPPRSLVAHCMDDGGFDCMTLWEKLVHHTHDGLPYHTHEVAYSAWKLRHGKS